MNSISDLDLSKSPQTESHSIHIGKKIGGKKNKQIERQTNTQNENKTHYKGHNMMD